MTISTTPTARPIHAGGSGLQSLVIPSAAGCSTPHRIASADDPSRWLGSGFLRFAALIKNAAAKLLLAMVFLLGATSAAAQTVTNVATVTPPVGITNPGTSCTAAGSVYVSSTGACSATDTDPIRPTVTVSKISSNGVGTFSFTGTNGYAGDTITTVTSGVTVAGQTRTLDAVSTETDITEVPLPNTVLIGVTCTGLGAGGAAVRNLTADPVGGIPPYTVRLNAAATASGSNINCTFNNNFVLATLQLSKAWGANAITGDVASIGATTNGANNTVPFTSTASTGASSAVVNVVAGNNITLPAETMSPGTLTNYNTVLSCTASGGPTANALSGTDGQQTNTLLIGNGDIGKAITCTYTNTRKTANLTLAKTWANAIVNDAVSVNASGLSALVSVAGSANETDTASAQTVRAGDVITFSETFSTGSASNYNAVLSCTGTTGLVGNVLTVGPADTAITCTYTNTRKTASLTLRKAWSVNSLAGDAITVTTTGGTTNATLSSIALAAGNTTTGATVTVQYGNTITLSAETFTTGSQANYITTVSCNNSSGALVNDAAQGVSFTVGNTDTALVCTYTNTRRPPVITTTKTASASTLAVGATNQYYDIVINVAFGPTTDPLLISDSLPAGISLNGLPFVIAGTTTANLSACPNSGSNTTGCSVASGVGNGSFTVRLPIAVGPLATSGTNTVNLTGGGDPFCTPALNEACDATTPIVLIGSPPTLTGKVFNDGGAPSAGVNTGLPNNGLQDGAEAGLGGISVRLTNCGGTTYASTQTDGTGQYSFLLPASVIPGSSVCVVAVPLASQLATGANVSGTVTPSASTTSMAGVSYSYDRTTSSLAFQLPATSVSGLNFGLVAVSTWAANSNLNGVPGSTVRHLHQFVAGTGGSVTFSVASSTAIPAVNGWSETLFNDRNCDGSLSGVETASPLTSLVVVQGQTVCVIMEQFIPAGVSSGASNTVVLQAGLHFTNAAPALSVSARLTDVTTVGVSAVRVFKEVRNITQGGTYGVSNQARPGDVLQYRITYINNAATAVTELVLNDATPAFTSFLSAAESSVPAGLSGCMKNTPANPEPAAAVSCDTLQATGGSGSLRWRYAGSLLPGATGSVVFSVTVQP